MLELSPVCSMGQHLFKPRFSTKYETNWIGVSVIESQTYIHDVCVGCGKIAKLDTRQPGEGDDDA